MRRVVPSVILLGLLTGCMPFGPTSSLLDDVRDIDGGECIKNGLDQQLDLTNVVPCTEPHVWEIVGVVPLPGEEYADFDRMVDDDGLLVADVFEMGLRACVPLVSEWSGLADTVGAVEPFASPDVMLWPAFGGNLVVSTTPEMTWGSYRALVCAIEWADADGLLQPQTSADSEPAITRLVSGTMAGVLRQCVLYTPKGYEPAPDCDLDPHSIEHLFTFDVAAVLGRDWVDAVDLKNITEKEWAALDEVCGAATSAVFGVGPREDVQIIADIPPEHWGIGPLGADHHSALCGAVPSDPSMLLVGQVWSLRSRPAGLVPGTGTVPVPV